MTAMKQGDRVFVFPKAHGRKGAWGRVVEASVSNHSLMVAFEDRPHFCADDAFAALLIESSPKSFVLALWPEQNATPFWTDFTLGLACWPSGIIRPLRRLRALFAYNLLTALYLGLARRVQDSVRAGGPEDQIGRHNVTARNRSFIIDGGSACP
jgi:hypothetical protein